MRLVCSNLVQRRPQRLIGGLALLLYMGLDAAAFTQLAITAPIPQQIQRQAAQQSNQLVFVDPGVKDAQTLLKGLPANSQVIVLDANRDGVEQMTAAIAQRQNLTGIHILSHGQAGSVLLGRTQLNRLTLDRYTPQLQQWAKSLAPGADVLFYGCDLAGNPAGQKLIQQLSQLTGADIAASTNRTGNAKLGGDWVLETQTGKIETAIAFNVTARNAYPGVLPPPCLPNPLYSTTGTNVGIVNLNTGQLTPAGTLAFPTFASTRQEVTGLLYYIEETSTNTSVVPRVATWNPQTGVNTILGTTGTTGVIFQKLAQQATTGTLYAGDGNTNALYTINPVTGVAASNITIALPFPPGGGGGDMAFDPQDPNRLLISVRAINRVQLYAVTVPATPPTTPTILTPTLIGDVVTVPIGNNPANPNIANTGALAFGQDGNLYLVVREDNPLNTPVDGDPRGTLYRINQAGTVTAVSRTPFSSDFATLPVPTPTVNLIPAKRRDSTLQPGSPITYTITVQNPPATCDVTGISVVDNVPPFVIGTTWSSTVTGIGSVTPATGSGNALNLSVNLDTGSTATITIRGTVDPNGSTVAANIATIQNPPGINPEPPIVVTDQPIPRLRLIKRITNITRRGNPIPGINFSAFVDDPADPNDTVSGWSQLSPVGILQAGSIPQIKTGDIIEYTIYYLNDGTTDLTDTGICDPIPEQTTFVPNSSQVKVAAADPAPGGQFFSPLAPLPANNPCPSQTNPNGTALFNLGTLPSAVGSNFGFVRFRTRIN
jgi:uncharacterized repeat protein (TIGR01451 family)